MKKALIKFTKTSQNKRPPDQIIIYRDGVGGPTYEEFVIRNEGPGGGALWEATMAFAPNYRPKIVYCMINKNVTTRLFE
jgi:hypothetical protein